MLVCCSGVAIAHVMARRYEIGADLRIVPEFGLLAPTVVAGRCRLWQDA
jgi:hypothetical protein